MAQRLQLPVLVIFPALAIQINFARICQCLVFGRRLVGRVVAFVVGVAEATLPVFYVFYC